MEADLVNIYINVLNKTIDGLVKEKILLQAQKEYSEQQAQKIQEELIALKEKKRVKDV
jgi:hypothetical protein